MQINEFYSFFNTEISVDIAEIEIDYQDNFAFNKSNNIWFPDHIKHVRNADFVEYALTSQDYLNRVASWHRLFFNNYLGHLKDYKESALILIEDLDERTE